MNAPHGIAEVQRFYGWQDEYLRDLARWSGNMVVVPPPEGRGFFYDADADGDLEPHERARGIRVHAVIAEELRVCLALVSEAGLWRFVESVAGGYVFRMQRGSTKLSMHAYGAAVDFDAVRNPFRRVVEATALGAGDGLKVVAIFEARGWTWGGRWPGDRADAMHFQFASGV